MNETLARGIAKSLFKRCYEQQQAFLQHNITHYSDKKTSWLKAEAEDLKRKAGFLHHSSDISRSGKNRKIMVVAICAIDGCRLPSIDYASDPNKLGLGLVIVRANATNRILNIELHPYRVSQHAIERFILRTKITDEKFIVAEAASWISVMFHDFDFNEMSTDQNGYIAGDHGLAIVKRSDGEMVVATFVGKDNMTDYKEQVWTYIRSGDALRES